MPGLLHQETLLKPILAALSSEVFVYSVLFVPFHYAQHAHQHCLLAFADLMVDQNFMLFRFFFCSN
jgi:hypothetical protein